MHTTFAGLIASVVFRVGSIGIMRRTNGLLGYRTKQILTRTGQLVRFWHFTNRLHKGRNHFGRLMTRLRELGHHFWTFNHSLRRYVPPRVSDHGCEPRRHTDR